MRFFLTSTLIVIQILHVIAQNSILRKTYTCEQVESAADFNTAIDVGKAYSVKLNCSPNGRGRVVEVAGDNSKYYFAKEHNVVWIKFKAIRNSKLNVIIVPDSVSDDYDFQIYKGEGASTPRDILSKRLKPIRSNMARTKNLNKGITGLDYFSEEKNIGEGINPSFSKYLDVSQDDIYYLVLDNVYENGRGALIEFDYFSSKSINGKVLDEQGKALKADVVWENSVTGVTINTTTTDSLTGEFEMDVLYDNNLKNTYTLAVEADSHFFEERNFSFSDIKQMKPTPIELVLPSFKKGKRTRLSNINFVGGQAVFLKNAYPSLRRLHRLMSRNPNLTIHVEGHTNGCPNGTEDSQLLSEERASTVRSYLVEKGIDSSRITTEGFNCSRMLYPITSAEELLSLNRRVEIVVTDF